MKNRNNLSEPFVRIAKRDDMSFGKRVLVRLVAILLSLAVSAVIIFAITKYNPVTVYVTMFQGALGTRTRVWSTLKEMFLLTCIAVGLAPAFKMRFWNIGAEGQVLVGGIVSAGCMIYLTGLPSVALFTIMIISSVLIGAIWGLIPALFKAKWNTNETLFTLMMNYVAIQFTSFVVSKWENPYGSNTVGIINQNTRIGWLPALFKQQYLLDLLMVIGLVIFMYIYLTKSKHGYEIAVVGESENTARYAGINVKKVFIRTMLISGGICGFAGFLAVSGVSHTISTSTAGGRGFTAIIVAWLAKFNTFTMILISLLLAFLDNGATEIASKCKLNDYASDMIIGVILFFILGSEFFINYKLIFREKTAKEGK
ncbi:MAG: ABC transporter permease [Acetatifactor sp.]|nr:ABC transporter permease [Acetatifactor sp.]